MRFAATFMAATKSASSPLSPESGSALQTVSELMVVSSGSRTAEEARQKHQRMHHCAERCRGAEVDRREITHTAKLPRASQYGFAKT